MTALAAATTSARGLAEDRPRRGALPPLSPRLYAARGALVVVVVLATSALLQLTFVSSLQQRAAQQRAYDRFRGELAEGTAPVGPIDGDGRAVADGAPVAYVEVPAIGMRQVVGEGTGATTLFDGPGHRRDTPLPGQPGVSVLLGRRAAFGGPLARLAELRAGDTIHVTTGQGAYDYRVTGSRRDGDPARPVPETGVGTLPAQRAARAHLLLATADGRAFIPSGLLRIDAELVGPAGGASPPRVAPSALPAEERAMATDTTMLWALVLWMQALIVVVLGAVWAWHRMGGARAWVVSAPPLLLVGLCVAGEAARLLPNLL